MVFVFAGEDGDGDTGVFGERWGGAAEDGGAEGGAGEVAFDVCDHEAGAVDVGDEGRVCGVVEGVGQVAEEDGIDAVADELADAEGAAADAFVGVDAGDEDVTDAAGAEDVPDFGAAVRDEVGVGVDGDERVLLFPWVAGGETAFAFEDGLPCAGFFAGIVAAAGGAVDGVAGGGFGWVEAVEPA